MQGKHFGIAWGRTLLNYVNLSHTGAFSKNLRQHLMMRPEALPPVSATAVTVSAGCGLAGGRPLAVATAGRDGFALGGARRCSRSLRKSEREREGKKQKSREREAIKRTRCSSAHFQHRYDHQLALGNLA